MSMELPIQRVDASAALPKRGSPGAAGLDLFAAETKTLWQGVQTRVDTGIAIALPVDHVGLIWPRSGWAANYGIDTLAGVIDSDYRGSVQVVLINHGYRPIEITPGVRIAQLIVQRFEHYMPVEVETLGKTVRGDGGFGSTGE